PKVVLAIALPSPGGPPPDSRGGGLRTAVKPAGNIALLSHFVEKIERSGWEHEALLVGTGPFDRHDASPRIGMLAERVDQPWELGWEWCPARAFTCLSCGSVSVLAEDGSWRCRMCGVGDGNGHVGDAPDLIDREWAMSKDRVQWRHK